MPPSDRQTRWHDERAKIDRMSAAADAPAVELGHRSSRGVARVRSSLLHARFGSRRSSCSKQPVVLGPLLESCSVAGKPGSPDDYEIIDQSANFVDAKNASVQHGGSDPEQATGWACEVTSGGSGSWSCRSVLLPG